MILMIEKADHQNHAPASAVIVPPIVDAIMRS